MLNKAFIHSQYTNHIGIRATTIMGEVLDDRTHTHTHHTWHTSKTLYAVIFLCDED